MENTPIIGTARHGTAHPLVRIFWTGGWDSTYRLVELSRMPVTVEPVYCIDKERRSLEIERAAMSKILAALQAKPETKANFLPVKQIDIDTLPENQDITDAYKTICKTVRLGSQYEWLAKTALTYPGIETGNEKPNGEFSGCSAAIDQFGKLIHVNDTWKIDPEKSSPELRLLFENISFPIIMTTELEMRQNIHDWGYDDVMSNIWFCYTPINGKPCGKCRPCEQKMECGMEWLLPPEAHKRYKLHKKFEAALKIPVIGFGLRAVRKIYRLSRKLYRKIFTSR
ncbi:MAG: hypothetical protein IJS39_13115 [Synergistaceae bacterium]|nr:hypothetical protein [Synergistaceae bacterium]